MKDQEQQLLAVKSLEPSIRIISSACQYTKPICVYFSRKWTLGDGVLGLINLLLSGGTIESNQESVFTLLAYLYCCILFDSIKVFVSPRLTPSCQYHAFKTFSFFIVVVRQTRVTAVYRFPVSLFLYPGSQKQTSDRCRAFFRKISRCSTICSSWSSIMSTTLNFASLMM